MQAVERTETHLAFGDLRGDVAEQHLDALRLQEVQPSILQHLRKIKNNNKGLRPEFRASNDYSNNTT